MTNEKLNNDNWKAKLEDADSLQDYTLQNKNAAWENLHDKLHKKQQPKFLWYWMAAACLIAVITVISFMHYPAENNVAIHSSIKTKPEQKKQQPSQQPIQQPINQTINTTNEVAKSKTNIGKPIKQVADKNKIIITDSTVFQHNELTNIKTELPIIKDSAIQLTSTVAVAPKQMKIVHVNELDDDGSNINMVVNKSHIPSRIKIFNQDIYTDYTLSVPASGFNILKHKNSTSN